MKKSHTRINVQNFKVGMSLADVLEIVGDDNLFEVKPIIAMCLPNSEKVMSFRSLSVQSGCVLGFTDDKIDGIRLFSMN